MQIIEIQKKFKSLYNSEPLLVRSPGRINLIGEHTDYNEGFVLPAAVDKEIVITMAKNGTKNCRLYSFDYQQSADFALENLKPSKPMWANYIIGVVDQLQKAGYAVEGFDCVFGGDIPIGAGMSSSAALECGTAFALVELFNLEVGKERMVKMAQKAEHTFAGVQCGIMDQFASMMGKEDHAIRLDCRSLDFSYFPIHLKDYQLLLLDTQVKHSLASSEYNTRRKECEAGVATVKGIYPEVKSLRDISLQMLEEVKTQLDPVVYSRCSYIIEENERLLTGCELLEKGDVVGFGEKMYGSHEGLSNKYAVSCEELDFLVDYTKDKSYVAGARMMGGGFGGCTINLVAKGNKNTLLEEVSRAYQEKFNRRLQSYEVTIAGGTDLIEMKG